MLNRDYGFDTKPDSAWEGDSMRMLYSSKSEQWSKKVATEFQIKNEGKEEKKEFLGRV